MSCPGLRCTLSRHAPCTGLCPAFPCSSGGSSPGRSPAPLLCSPLSVPELDLLPGIFISGSRLRGSLTGLRKAPEIVLCEKSFIHCREIRLLIHKIKDLDLGAFSALLPGVSAGLLYSCAEFIHYYVPVPFLLPCGFVLRSSSCQRRDQSEQELTGLLCR